MNEIDGRTKINGVPVTPSPEVALILARAQRWQLLREGNEECPWCKGGGRLDSAWTSSNTTLCGSCDGIGIRYARATKEGFVTINKPVEH